MSYLSHNETYWQKGYNAPNVENFIFRTYGRILKPDFGLHGAPEQKVLDFGCGQGGNLAFFHRQGFDVYGVDISEKDLAQCRKFMPDKQEQFKLIAPQPEKDQRYFETQFDLIISVQTLYYLADSDLQVCLDNLYRALKPGGLFYATMMGSSAYYYQYAQAAHDGLYEVNFPADHRLNLSHYYMKFVHSKAEMESLFQRFEKQHLGYYDAQIRDDEGSEFHYTFLGQKPLDAEA